MQSRNLRATWLHVSDLHLKAGSYDSDVVTNALLRSLGSYRDKGLTPEFIVFSGDLAFSGGSDQYALASRFLDKLLDESGLDRTRLIVIPGNHDVDRSACLGLARTLSSREEADAYFAPGLEKPQFASALKNYADWYDDYFRGIRSLSRFSSCGPVHTFNCAALSVAILPINSALFCRGEDDHGKLWVGRRALDQGVGDVGATSSDLKIALMHHPISWLSELERPQISARIRREFDVLASGHLHSPDVLNVSSLEDQCLDLSAGALYQTRRWPNRAFFVGATEAELWVMPLRYEDEPSELWAVDPSLFPEAEGFVGRFRVPGWSSQGLILDPQTEEAAMEHAVTRKEDSPLVASTLSLPVQAGLFRAGSGEVLWAEPRLKSNEDEDEQGDFLSAQDVAALAGHVVITASHESGGSTLARLLSSLLPGSTLADASKLHSYKAKLQQDFKGIVPGGVLVLDGFDITRNERLLKEISSLSLFSRYVIIARQELPDRLPLGDKGELANILGLTLWGLGRTEIRGLAKEVLESGDEDFISAATDKVYNDLLGLSIPLTPGNTIMYLSVLNKEGEFSPLNRTEIMSRFVLNQLKRPSDAFSDTFGAKGKADVLSAFTFGLYERGKADFTTRDWANFCDQYCRDNLIDFSASELLSDLESTRTLIAVGDARYFRYSFVYTFFVGRHIASKPAVLSSFFASGRELTIDGLTEVIAGVLGDPTPLIEHLLGKVEDQLTRFEAGFIPGGFDPYEAAVWPSNNPDEEVQVWHAVSKQLEQGPAPVAELDAARTSIQKEKATFDQNVQFQSMKQLEVSLIRLSRQLLESLRSADTIDGPLKLRMVSAFLKTHTIGLQVGVLLAPQIARADIVNWGAITYRGFGSGLARILADVPEEDRFKAAEAEVVARLPHIVARQAADDIGLKKLGEVFKALAGSASDNPYMKVLLLACLSASKPRGWSETVASLINQTPREAYFSYSQLVLLMREFRLGVNRVQDRESLKRSVALIQARREAKKDKVGETSVTRTLRLLEDAKEFASAVDFGSQGMGNSAPSER